MRRSRRRLAALAGIVTSVLLLALPAGADATFHLMMVREIYPGSGANPEAEYVELQMWASGQNRVEGHVLRTYDGAGHLVGSSTFPADATSGANQSTLVLATPQAEAEFGIVADAPLASGGLSPAGGAVCWEEIDCVAWGGFAGSPPSRSGTPVAPAGIPDGMAIRRSVANGCATALDPSDDSDNSLADFAPAFPAPRPNSVPPTEQLCASAGGSGPGPSGGGSAPETILRRHPPRRGVDRTPTFRFAADAPAVRFQCKVDGRPFRTCRSPFTTRRLSLGLHRFQVRALGSDGNVDPTPASYRFRIVRAR